MADLELLRYTAAKTGLGLKYLSKDEKLSLMLEQLRDIFPEVILKGGTALNRAYLSKASVSRFSEDIDLDFIREATLENNVSRIREGMSGVKGFYLGEPRIRHRTLRFDCSYDFELGGRDQIQVEFYINDIKSVNSEDILIKSPFLETHSTIFKTYSLEDLIARKFMALHNRTEGKDIYDLFYSLDLAYNDEILTRAMSLAMEFYRIEEGGFFDRIGVRLADARSNWSYIGKSTNHFIPDSLRPEWKIFIETLALKIERKFVKKA